MRVLDVNTLKPLKPGDFGYDLNDAVAVAVQMPKVWKVDDYTFYMGYDLEEVLAQMVEDGHDNENHLPDSTPLTAKEMNELDYIRDDGTTVKFIDEYKRLVGQGVTCCLFASELF